MTLRPLYFLTFLATTGLLGFGLYAQYYQGFEPCPLCTLQRLAYVIVGASALLGFFTYRYTFTRYLYSSICLLFSVLGFSLAIRQTWIQLYPSADMSECGVSLQYMLQVLPWHEVARKILAGSAECSNKTWSLLTLSMAQWSILAFTGLIIVSLILFKRSGKP